MAIHGARTGFIYPCSKLDLSGNDILTSAVGFHVCGPSFYCLYTRAPLCSQLAGLHSTFRRTLRQMRPGTCAANISRAIPCAAALCCGPQWFCICSAPPSATSLLGSWTAEHESFATFHNLACHWCTACQATVLSAGTGRARQHGYVGNSAHGGSHGGRERSRRQPGTTL